MSYVHGGRLSYQDYLSVESLVNGLGVETRKAGARIATAVSKNTREMIASNEALARENIRMMTDVSERLDEGFERLTYELENISDEIVGLRASFDWGFSQLLANIDGMHDTLKELVQLAKTPAQVAAYEQFEIARDAYRRNLFVECLESLDKAINGDHASSGYKLEWRFHQLKGVLRLGFPGCEVSLVDLPDAERSFLATARYAGTDFPDQAAQAFLSAGWAAYCLGNMKEALSHTEQAIQLNPSMGEALFQVAKVKMALGDVDGALPLLKKAVELDRFYTIKAAGDGDFKKHNVKLHDFIEKLREEKHNKTLAMVISSLQKIKHWLNIAPDAYTHPVVSKWVNFIETPNLPYFDILDIAAQLDQDINNLLQLATNTCSVKRNTLNETYRKEVLVKKRWFSRDVIEIVDADRTFFKDKITCGDGTAFHYDFYPVPAGVFLMGVTNEDSLSLGFKAEITKQYHIGSRPVSKDLWDLVMGSDSSKYRIDNNGCTSWGAIEIFLSRLNRFAGGDRYRLPTEAEWEFACRAGKKYYRDEAKNPNSLGLEDMQVKYTREWCKDRFCARLDELYSGIRVMIDPKGPTTSNNDERVVRTGNGRYGERPTHTSCRFRLVSVGD